jgi:N-acylneuraminate cytidylyltransferase
MDFDGVHTDDKVTVDENGVESVTVSRKDGMGIELLRNYGLCRLLILTKETNPVVLRRAEKLGVECLHSRDNKLVAMETWLEAVGLTWDEVMFVGNDVNDTEVLARAAIAACPCDAHPHVLAIAHWIIPLRGGEGVVRAVADLFLSCPKSADV